MHSIACSGPSECSVAFSQGEQSPLRAYCSYARHADGPELFFMSVSLNAVSKVSAGAAQMSHDTRSYSYSQGCKSFRVSATCRAGENWITLLRFAELQTIAQAQSTALALGAHHSAALLASPTHKSGYVLSTLGRGEFGCLLLKLQFACGVSSCEPVAIVTYDTPFHRSLVPPTHDVLALASQPQPPVF